MKKSLILMLVLASAVMIGSCIDWETSQNKDHTKNNAWIGDTEYTVYFELKDKTTGEQIISKEEAAETILEIFEKKGANCTVLDAFDDGLEKSEEVSDETVILDILMVSETELKETVKEAVDELHLSSAMVTRSDFTQQNSFLYLVK